MAFYLSQHFQAQKGFGWTWGLCAGVKDGAGFYKAESVNLCAFPAPPNLLKSPQGGLRGGRWGDIGGCGDFGTKYKSDLFLKPALTVV